MMKNILLAFTILCSVSYVRAQELFSVNKGLVTFYSHALIEDITAENKQPGSMINMTTRDIAVIIPIRNFKFAKELMQEHFNERPVLDFRVTPPQLRNQVSGCESTMVEVQHHRQWIDFAEQKRRRQGSNAL